MNCYESTFGTTRCHVDVVVRPTVSIGPAFIATPYAFDASGEVARWFANSKGHPTEIIAPGFLR